MGRDAELAVLGGLMRQTAAGTGGAVLLAGEPGVGKTRLAREAAARADSVTVSWGACRESAGAPPLWPWIQVLRRLGETTAAVDADGAGAGTGPAARFRLFERIGQVLLAAAGTAPHVVIIDDLHRADEASLRLLGYLSEALWPAPIGMIVAYRDTEVSSGSLAAEVIAGLARGQASSRCELAGLSAGSVAQWLRAVGADGIDAADLHARTGGNPLFISESIRLLADGSPSGVPGRAGRAACVAAAGERPGGDQGAAGAAAARLP